MGRIPNSRDLSSHRMLIESERLNDVFRDEGAFRSMIDERRVVEFRWEATALKSCVDGAFFAAFALRTESEACCRSTPGVNEKLC